MASLPAAVPALPAGSPATWAPAANATTSAGTGAGSSTSGGGTLMVLRGSASWLDAGSGAGSGVAAASRGSSTGSDGFIAVRDLGSLPTAAGSPLRVELPADTFRHSSDGNELVWVATRADGSPLPDWVRFDAGSRRFSIEPPADARGTVPVRVTARDRQGRQASTVLTLQLSGR